MAKTRQLTDTERSAWNDAPPLIRTHLWLGTTPPPSNDKRDWTMGREHSIWTRLVLTGRDPEEINGAIEFARTVIHQPDEPLTLRIFYWDGATPNFEQARAAWINAQADVSYGGKTKVSPTIRDVMRRMGDG